MIIVIGLGVIGFALSVLPASLLARLLPPQVHAADFSGSIWHGSAGSINAYQRDFGALEWRLQPMSLLELEPTATLHWVKNSAVLDATLVVSRRGFSARDIRGAGTLEDVSDLNLAPGWRGGISVALHEITGDFRDGYASIGLRSLIGTLETHGLSAAGIASGADLGGYALRFGPDAVGADGSVTAAIADLGGPLEAQGQIRYAPALRTGTLSGTLKERADAPPSLRQELGQFSQLRARDAAGRIPVDMEFSL